MTKEEAQAKLQGIANWRQRFPDASPELRAEADRKESGYLATMRNLVRASVESDIGDLRRQGKEDEARTMDIAGENIRPFTNPEIKAVQADAPNRNLQRASVEENKARQNYEQAGRRMPGTALRQAGGTAAAAAGLVPGAVPAAEAARELADIGGPIDMPTAREQMTFRGQQWGGAPPQPLGPEGARLGAKGLPREGETARYVEESPSPFSAKAVALGGALLTGRLPGPIGGATRLTERGLRHVLPGRLAPSIAAPAAVGAGIGGVEAGIRRIPAALDPNQEVPPLQPSELLAPAGASGVFAALPGGYRALRGWATNPLTETGIHATRWARNRASGLNNALERRYAKGNMGVSQLDEDLGRNLDVVKRDAKTAADVEMETASAPIRARTREELSAAELERKAQAGENVMAKGRAAAEIEPVVYNKLTRYRTDANASLKSEFDSAAARDAELGPRFSNDDFLADVRKIVASKARPGAGGTRQVDTGMVDEFGKPVMREEAIPPGAGGEVHTPLGQRYANIEREAEKFLPKGQKGTVAQVKNFIAYLKAQADSGTPEMAYPAKEILWSARRRLGEADPMYAEASARWKARTTELEQFRKRAMGSDDLHKQGVEDPQSELDAPEVGSPSNPPPRDPKEVEATRRYLMAQGDRTAAQAVRAPDRRANEQVGFEDELGSMDEQLARIDDTELSQARRFEENKALRGEAEQRELARTRREVDERAAVPVRSAENRAKETMEAKETLELARFPGTRRLLRPSLKGAIGMTYRNPAHGAAAIGETGLSLTQAAAIPVAARLAAAPPTLGQALRLPGIENTVPMAVAATRPELPREGADEEAMRDLPRTRVAAESLAQKPEDVQKLLKRRRRPQARTPEELSQALKDKARSVYGQSGRLTAPMLTGPLSSLLSR